MVTFLGGLTWFSTRKDDRVIRGRRNLLNNPKRHGDLFGRFDLVLTPEGQRVIRGRLGLRYDPKGHHDRFKRFNLVYDRKRSQDN